MTQSDLELKMSGHLHLGGKWQLFYDNLNASEQQTDQMFCSTEELTLPGDQLFIAFEQ